jgi:hypothetical protein
MRLYQGGCSFLQSPDIFVDTCLSEYFGKDLVNINNCMGGSSNTQIFRKAFFSIMKSDFDFVLIGWSQSWRHDKAIYELDFNDTNRDILLEESNKEILNSELGYHQIIGSSHNNSHCNLEPQGTDNVIMYTLALQNLLKSKNIRHLFVTMGECNLKTLESRRGWLDLIDSNNYYGNGDIISKMSHSVTKDFTHRHVEEGYRIPLPDECINDGDGYIRDNVSHLNENAKQIFANKILKHITGNKLI